MFGMNTTSTTTKPRKKRDISWWRSIFNKPSSVSSLTWKAMKNNNEEHKKKEVAIMKGKRRPVDSEISHDCALFPLLFVP